MKRLLPICACVLAWAASPAVAPAAGSVGVIVSGDPVNIFGGYATQILKAEGFADPKTVSLSGLTLAKLQSYDTVVLSQTSLSTAEAQLFRDYVSTGGRLIGFRPDSKLDNVFGIARTAGTLSEGYTKLNATAPICAGLETTTSMKTHGDSDLYAPTGGSAVKAASLYNGAGSTDTGYATVIQSSYGSGKTVAFSYDLAKSIATMRQGNPAWAGEDREGVSGTRPSDLFYDTTPGSTHWNDITRSGILQADEQMRLLTHSVETLNAAKTPMPRLWYFPNAKKSVLVWTGDQDGGATSIIEDELSTVEAHGGTASIYLLGNPPSQQKVNEWIGRGHEIGVHVDGTSETIVTWSGMNSNYDSQFNAFHTTYQDAPYPPKTIRNHSLRWCGYDSEGQKEFAAQAQIDSNHGVGVDFNYYYWQPSFQGTGGYSIPSGLPMKFIKSNGQLTNTYQADTQIADEGLGSQCAEKYADLLDASLNHGKYAWVVANFHPTTSRWGSTGPIDYAAEGDALLDTAQANGIPIWSGAKMESFLRMRESVTFQDVQWADGVLSFLINAPVSGEGQLTLMLPGIFGGHPLDGLFLGGANTDYTIMTIAGSDYALFTVDSGTHAVTATYTPEPRTLVLLLVGGFSGAAWLGVRRRFARIGPCLHEKAVDC